MMKFLRDAILTFLFIGFLNFSTLPEISVRVVNSKQYEPDIERKKDTFYLVNFWTTWKDNGQDEQPSALNKISRTNKDEKYRVMLVSRELQVNGHVLPLLKTHQISSEAVLPDGPDHAWMNHVDPGHLGEIPFTAIHEHDSRNTWNSSFFDALVSQKFNAKG